MKINRIEYFSKADDYSETEDFLKIIDEISKAINKVTWFKSNKFVINPVRKGNGVFPIKDKFIASLKRKGWKTEQSMSLALGMNPGPIDAIKTTKEGIFAVEWETGNISSSHRALNKIATGILQKQIIGGILILPVRNLSKYLTDRVGNYEEIAPYFEMYRALKFKKGIIGVIAIDYDDVSPNAPLIPKGKDGNAKK
jgi:hypothetical protein